MEHIPQFLEQHQGAFRPGRSQLGDEVARPGRSQLGDEVAWPGRSQMGDEVARPGWSQLGDEVARPGLSQLGDALQSAAEGEDLTGPLFDPPRPRTPKILHLPPTSSSIRLDFSESGFISWRASPVCRALLEL